MFDSQLGGPDAATTLSLVSAAHRLVLDHECRLVELAAHWADLHHPDSQVSVERLLPGSERGRRLGGEGTPEVLEFAAAELGARLETSSGSARALMADALDLPHRLPELWQLIIQRRGAGVEAAEGGPGHPAFESRCGDAGGCRGGPGDHRVAVGPVRNTAGSQDHRG